MHKAIIGGTGISSLPGAHGPYISHTSYGDVETYRFVLGNEEILFLPRHGRKHSTPPHAINYRAQMTALKDAGVTHVYALATSGSMDVSVPEGSIVVIEDFIDFTTNRIKTFYDGSDSVVAHTDMSDPYCANLRSLFMHACKEEQLSVFEHGVYVCTDGPRFESRSEIAMYKKLGGTLVGMTGIPEVFLAKELGLCYASIGLISNLACGISSENLAKKDHGQAISQAKEAVIRTICRVFTRKNLTQEACQCAHSVLYL